MKKSNLFLVLLFFTIHTLSAQDTINLINPSFEGTPVLTKNNVLELNGWKDLSIFHNSPIDIQPGLFEVDLPPQHGKNYVSLVTRENQSWEVIGQELPQALLANNRYAFSVHLAQSESFRSHITARDEMKSFNQPVQLRILASHSSKHNHKDGQLLASSTLIDHNDWKKYIFEFVPDADYKYLIFEAFFETPSLSAYNGHLLIDHCSPIFLLEKKDKAEKVLKEH